MQKLALSWLMKQEPEFLRDPFPHELHKIVCVTEKQDENGG